MMPQLSLDGRVVELEVVVDEEGYALRWGGLEARVSHSSKLRRRSDVPA